MTMRYVNFKVYDPVYVAIDKGFFAKYNLEVKIIGDVLGGPTAIQAVAAGAAEAGLSSIPAIINANAAGLPVIGTTDIQSALPKQPLEYYYVRADSPIKSIKDLKGKQFAVNLIKSSFHYTAIMALEQSDMTEKDVNFVLLAFDKQEEALIRGQVDVIGLMEPYNTHAIKTYGDKIRLLFSAPDVFGNKQFCTHFVNRVWAQYNPAAVQAFVSGIVDAAVWIEAHQDEARPIIAKYTGIETAFIPDYYFQPQAQSNMADVQFWLDYLLKRGDVTASWLKAENIATNKWNSAVK